MSFSRFVVGAVMISASLLAINVYAQTVTSTPAAAVTAPVTHNTKAMHETKDGKTKLDINTADSAALAKIKGIGPTKAQAIVEYRDKNGKFKSVDDLKDVKSAKGKAYFNAKAIKKLTKKLTVN